MNFRLRHSLFFHASYKNQTYLIWHTFVALNTLEKLHKYLKQLRLNNLKGDTICF